MMGTDMTDATATAAPTEIEAAPPEAAAEPPEATPPAPAGDSLRHGGANSEPAATDAPAEQADMPVLPPIEYPIGPMRQAVLDHLLDTVDAGAQSVAQILAAMPPGTTRNTAESVD